MSIILMCGMLLPYVQPVMATGETGEAVAAQEELLTPEQNVVPEAEPEEDAQQAEPEETLGEKAASDQDAPAGDGAADPSAGEEDAADKAPAGEDAADRSSAEEDPADKAPAEGNAVDEASDETAASEEAPAGDPAAREDPAEKTAAAEDAAEEETQHEEILYTLTYSGLSNSAELEVRKLDPEDKDDAHVISELQKQLGEQKLYD
ncbi:MAG: hypothetical protein IJ049_02165, partial [Oscillospiraceae bacterium]|nr:hypothetical protein [Oscillospiraceae bacterium]